MHCIISFQMRVSFIFSCMSLVFRSVRFSVTNLLQSDPTQFIPQESTSVGSDSVYSARIYFSRVRLSLFRKNLLHLFRKNLLQSGPTQFISQESTSVESDSVHSSTFLLTFYANASQKWRNPNKGQFRDNNEIVIAYLKYSSKSSAMRNGEFADAFVMSVFRNSTAQRPLDSYICLAYLDRIYDHPSQDRLEMEIHHQYCSTPDPIAS
ncbi:hypothetical protein Tcan_00644, partial [Toxocara canis]